MCVYNLLTSRLVWVIKRFMTVLMLVVCSVSLKINHFQKKDTKYVKANFNLHVEFQTFHKHTTKIISLTSGIKGFFLSFFFTSFLISTPQKIIIRNRKSGFSKTSFINKEA